MKQMLISLFPEFSEKFTEQQHSRIKFLSLGDTGLRDYLYPCERTLAEFLENEPGEENVKKEENFEDFAPNSSQVSESPLRLESIEVAELLEVKDVVKNFSKVSSKSPYKDSHTSITECLYSVPRRDFFVGITSWKRNDLYVKFMEVKFDHYVFDKMPNGLINVGSHGSFGLKLSTVFVLKQYKEFIEIPEGLSKISAPNNGFCGGGGEAKLHAIAIAHSNLLVWRKRHALPCNLHGYRDYCFEYITSLPIIERRALKLNYEASDELVHYLSDVGKQGRGCEVFFPFDPGSFWVGYSTLSSHFAIVVVKSWHLKVWFNLEPTMYYTNAILAPNQCAMLFPFDPGGIAPHVSEFIIEAKENFKWTVVFNA